jgi:aspartate racemase
MKTIGLIGGLSHESTIIYYQHINEMVREQLGELNAAQVLLDSINMQEVAQRQHNNKWDELEEMMANSALKLEKAGVDAVMIGTNSMHLCAPAVLEKISVPLLHIADATGQAIQEKGIKKVALLGTEFTMTKNFYKDHLKNKYDVETLVPEGDDNKEVSRIIYEELCKGDIKASSKEFYLNVIKKLQKKGAQGVILGCTEIPLLISQEDIDIPVFDTTFLHSKMAVDFILDLTLTVPGTVI